MIQKNMCWQIHNIMIQVKGLNEYPNSKKMVVTETSKVHNDYEFVPTKETLPKIVSQRKALQINLTMLVYGNTILNAGDVINFTEPVRLVTKR